MDAEYEAWLEKKRSDPRSTEQLLADALYDDGAIGVLQCRGDLKVFEAARELCSHSVPRERELGAHLLGQLGLRAKPFQNEAVEILKRLLRAEKCIAVLSASAIALGHRCDPRAVPALAALMDHPSEDVRYAVVHGLLTQEDPRAIETLIELSRDPDDKVRDWATFGLGSQLDLDTPDIREALCARLDDDDDECRGEALVGLAKRKDPRVLEPLLRELSLDSVTWVAVEAAYEFPVPALLPALQSLAEWWDEDSEMLRDAIRRCRGEVEHEE